jgi:phosphoribosylformylglycinamidine (FGAM) synthase PurS component
MIKLGPASGEMRAMSDDDIFLSRLKLLIIMAKAFLKNCPIGKYRKSAIIENAHHVFYHSLGLVHKTAFFKNHDLKALAGFDSEGKTDEEYVFHQRVQLLSVMAKALAENRLTGNFRKKALQDNLERICETLLFNFHIKDVEFLKVA